MLRLRMESSQLLSTLHEVAKANGAFTVKGYVRFETGEGLEKKNVRILQQKLLAQLQ